MVGYVRDDGVYRWTLTPGRDVPGTGLRYRSRKGDAWGEVYADKDQAERRMRECGYSRPYMGARGWRYTGKPDSFAWGRRWGLKGPKTWLEVELGRLSRRAGYPVSLESLVRRVPVALAD